MVKDGRDIEEDCQSATALEQEYNTGRHWDTWGGNTAGEESNGTAVPSSNGPRRLPPLESHAARKFLATESGGRGGDPKGPTSRRIQWQRATSMSWVRQCPKKE